MPITGTNRSELPPEEHPAQEGVQTRRQHVVGGECESPSRAERHVVPRQRRGSTLRPTLRVEGERVRWIRAAGSLGSQGRQEFRCRPGNELLLGVPADLDQGDVGEPG